MVLDPRDLQKKGAGGGSEVEIEDVGETEATSEPEDIRMSEMPNTTATEIEIGAETEMGALATND